MNLKHLVGVIALASVTVGANAAAISSTTYDLGDATIGAPLPFQGTVTPAGLFMDVFTFSLPENGGSGYSVIDFPLSIPGIGTFSTLLTTMTLVSNPDGVLYTDDDVVLDTVDGTGDSLSMTWGPTTGGSMYLLVAGATNGTLGGLYSGAISVAAVPELENWAMLLAGLGLVGMQLRRKQKSSDKVSLN